MGSAAVESKLFEPLQIGPFTLSSRLVMAPLTRYRADEQHAHSGPFGKEYYTQRAAVPGTLLITEATMVSPLASGLANAPGIWNQEQIDAWKDVVDSVHNAGSYMVLQLWGIGRSATPEVRQKEGNGQVVSASPIPLKEGAPVPRELTGHELEELIQDYATAARNAIEGAGFDGVEIHAANGYLVDTFIQDVSNQRTDKWGGSIENRSRFPLEIAKAVVNAVGSDRVGIRLSPWSTFQGMKMKDPVPQYLHLLRGLKDLDLAYVHFIESGIAGNAETQGDESLDPFINEWKPTGKPVLLAGGFSPESAKQTADVDYPDVDVAVVFGRHFIANPDLVFRMKEGIELTKYDRATFYTYKTGAQEGYTDYPFSKEWERKQLRN